MKKSKRLSQTNSLTKFLALLLIGSTTVTPGPTLAQSSSEQLLIVNGGDLPMNHWATQSILLAIDKYQVLALYPDHKFRGDTIVTRSEIAFGIYNLIKYFEKNGISVQKKSSSTSFKDLLIENGGDLDGNHWATSVIRELVETYGLMSGYPDKTFRSSRPLTRYEMIALYAKLLNSLRISKYGLTSRFEKSLVASGGDLEPGHWAEPAAKLVLSHGIMNLYDHRKINGQNNLTRYELAYSLAQIGDLAERKQNGVAIFADEKPASNSETADRLALVIGNADYKTVGSLDNPLNDARDMAKTLKQIGFTVILKENLATRRDFLNAIQDEYKPRIRKNGSVLFYYAGHGMQINGQNYLVPTQAMMKTEADKEAQTLSLDILFDTFTDAGSGINIVMLDACRNNPFSQSVPNDGRGIRIAPNHAVQGLANLNISTIPTGTFISYATAAGQVASDGNNRNGLYTQELLKAMRKKGLKIEDVDKEVRKNVRSLSGGKQIPWQSSNLESDFVFNP